MASLKPIGPLPQHPPARAGVAPAIETRGLRRVYRGAGLRKASGREVIALDGIDIEVPSGQLFGFLGPNGAGKTTLIKILATLLLPSEGTARVAGYDVTTEAARIRPLINMVSGGEQSGYSLITVEETLWMFSQLYGLSYRVARARIDELLWTVGLHEVRRRKVQELSTGMRQKLNLCRGLINDPQILFLDEPTLGLDVKSAREIRTYLREWVRRGNRTILLTTHYMQEAQELCDTVAIIDRGRILATGTPEELIRRATQAAYFSIHIDRQQDSADLTNLPGVRSCRSILRDGWVELQVETVDDGEIAAVVSALTTKGRRILKLVKVEPTLEQAFINIVGRHIDENVT